MSSNNSHCPDGGLSKVARTYLLTGLTQYEQGEHRKAIQDYTKAIEIAKNYVAAYVNRGLSHPLSGHYKRSLEDFETALKLDPEYMQAYYFRPSPMRRRANMILPSRITATP